MPTWTKAREIEVCFILQSAWGHCGFRFDDFGYFKYPIFGFVPKKLWFFGFLVHFDLRILRDLAFGFRFSSKIQTGSRNFFDLSSI